MEERAPFKLPRPVVIYRPFLYVSGPQMVHEEVYLMVFYLEMKFRHSHYCFLRNFGLFLPLFLRSMTICEVSVATSFGSVATIYFVKILQQGQRHLVFHERMRVR
jgi:hypothetical protein